ncbi:MAG TPA: PRC-barrel domain-containing protein [Gemmatimonadales bacterium]|jgi:sporulation protein YlmC with PRC-barrel domain
MTDPTAPSLIKLSDSDQVLADPAEDIRGKKVHDRDGDDLGTVGDLLIDADEGKVRFLLVEHGGILGIGSKSTFIPVDAVDDIDDNTVHVTEPRERIAAAPAYDPELMDAADYYDSVYAYYGVPSFWSAGYIYPGYPFIPRQ